MKTGLEPLAELMIERIANHDGSGGMTTMEAYQLSQAISLKRIADAIDRLAKPLEQLDQEIEEAARGH